MKKDEYPKMIYKNGTPKHGEAEKLEQNVDWVIVYNKDQHDACLKEWGKGPEKVENVLKQSENKEVEVEANTQEVVKPRRRRRAKSEG